MTSSTSARTDPPAADAGDLREQVRAAYAEAASRVSGGCCGGDSQVLEVNPPATGGDDCCGPAAGRRFGSGLYDAGDLVVLPEDAVQASLGCGNPLAIADLNVGDTVLDLGSGGGIDVLLSARRVGPTGRAYGLDMTDEMLDLARRNAAAAGATNVEFLRGHIEEIPLPSESIDVIISNCVVNLSGDKAAVFAEMFRVLRPGGRVGISDVVAEDRLTPAERAARGSHVGCIAGALSRTEYESGLRAAGFAEVSVAFTHEVGEGIHGALVRAVRPPAQG